MRSLPLLPFLMYLTASLLLGLALFIWIMPERDTPILEALTEPPQSTAPVTPAPLLYPPNATGLAAQHSLLAASPFHADRSAYKRASITRRAPPPPPPPKTYNPIIVGVFGRGTERRVMIKWETSTEPITHKMGASTPWGKLSEIGETNLVFEDGQKKRELDLYGR